MKLYMQAQDPFKTTEHSSRLSAIEKYSYNMRGEKK